MDLKSTKKQMKKMVSILKVFIIQNLVASNKESEQSSPTTRELESKWFENLSKIKRRIKNKSIKKQIEFTPNNKNDSKQSAKIKQLINKILITKSENKEKSSTENENENQIDWNSSSRCQLQISPDGKYGMKSSCQSRYDKIDEESSNINTDSMLSSDLSEGIPINSKSTLVLDQQKGKINKELEIKGLKSWIERENKRRESQNTGKLIFSIYRWINWY